MKIFNFHNQNLNDKAGTDRQGSGLFHGRNWLTLFDRFKINSEWLLGSKSFNLQFSWGGYDNEDFGFNICIPPIALYLNFEGFLPRKLKNWDWERSTGISIHNWTAWLELWNDDSDSSKGFWSFNYGVGDLLSLIFGRNNHSQKTIKETDVTVPMPEGNYEGKVKIFESKWKRARLPWAKYMVRSEIEVPKGIPYPGKGENSWDCGTQHTYSITSPRKTIEGAIAGMVESILNTRKRYGGSVNWMPDAVKI